MSPSQSGLQRFVARLSTLPPEALEMVVLAGARFDWFLRRVRSA